LPAGRPGFAAGALAGVRVPEAIGPEAIGPEAMGLEPTRADPESATEDGSVAVT
jgi:hypothetical protein